MKIHNGPPPKAEIIISKAENGRLEYDLWLVTATRLGGARKMGTSRLATDGGTTHANLRDVALAYLLAAGEDEIAEMLSQRPTLRSAG